MVNFTKLFLILKIAFLTNFIGFSASAEEISKEKTDKINKLLEAIELEQIINAENNLTIDGLLDSFKRSFGKCLDSAAEKQGSEYINNLLGYQSNKQYFLNSFSADFNDKELDEMIEISKTDLGKEILKKLSKKIIGLVKLRNALYKKNEVEFITNIQSVIKENLDNECLENSKNSEL